MDYKSILFLVIPVELIVIQKAPPIAKNYNVSGQRIRQMKRENEHKIKQAKQRLIDAVPDIIETVKKDCY